MPKKEKKESEAEKQKRYEEFEAKKKEEEKKKREAEAELFKKKNRERQKKYYDANKEKMAQKAKDRWAKTKAILDAHKEEIKKKGRAAILEKYKDEEPKKPRKNAKVIKKVVNKTEEAMMAIEEEEKEKEKEKPKKEKKKKILLIDGKRAVMNMSEVLEQIKENPKTSDGSYKIYAEDAKRLKLILSIDDSDNLADILDNPEKVIEKIESSDYALNVKKMTYQFILYLLDHTKIHSTTEAHDAYKLKFDVYKEDSRTQTKKKVEEEPTQDFPTYLELEKAKFGANSKMDLISRLYDEFTPRDDFQLKIVSSITDASDFDTNYIVIGGKMSDKSRHYIIVLNDFKTSNKYEPMKHSVSTALSNDMKKYMEEKGLQVGMYLFGDKKLTKYVSENNARMGIKGGINLYRHMKATQLLSKEGLTTEEKVLKAAAMGHSPAMQELYNRKKTA
jgi:hypothetical protein